MSDPTVAAAAREGLQVGLLLTAFLFGFRHGIDWDHIAAIADITSSQQDRRRAMRFATLYALGHALVVLVLGLIAIELGGFLPPAVDAAMERVVGATLLVLGIYVFYALIRYKRDFRMRSRWMLVFSAARRLVRWARLAPRPPEDLVVIEHEHEHEHRHEDPLHSAHDHAPEASEGPGAAGMLRTRRHIHRHRHRHVAAMPGDPFTEYGSVTAFAVGMIHGIGAETPTQILLFLVAVEAGGRVAGAFLLVAFLIGLLASNSLVALGATMGFLRAERNFFVYAAVAALAGALSLVLGALYLLGQGSLVPALL